MLNEYLSEQIGLDYTQNTILYSLPQGGAMYSIEGHWSNVMVFLIDIWSISFTICLFLTFPSFGPLGLKDFFFTFK